MPAPDDRPHVARPGLAAYAQQGPKIPDDAFARSRVPSEMEMPEGLMYFDAYMNEVTQARAVLGGILNDVEVRLQPVLEHPVPSEMKAVGPDVIDERAPVLQWAALEARELRALTARCREILNRCVLPDDKY